MLNRRSNLTRVLVSFHCTLDEGGSSQVRPHYHSRLLELPT
jgi:hypothetical protein